MSVDKWRKAGGRHPWEKGGQPKDYKGPLVDAPKKKIKPSGTISDLPPGVKVKLVPIAKKETKPKTGPGTKAFADARRAAAAKVAARDARHRAMEPKKALPMTQRSGGTYDPKTGKRKSWTDED